MDITSALFIVLGCIVLAHGFGAHIPEWVTPLATFVIVGYFFLKSGRTAGEGGESR